MIGVELNVEGAPVLKAALERGLLINCTQGNVIRLLPAMNLSVEQAQEGCDLLSDVFGGLANEGDPMRHN
jgi:acetylornithine/N-succinyldiaminopimelate aminotransferase